MLNKLFKLLYFGSGLALLLMISLVVSTTRIKAGTIPACGDTSNLYKLGEEVANVSYCPANTQCFIDKSDMYSKFECYGQRQQSLPVCANTTGMTVRATVENTTECPPDTNCYVNESGFTSRFVCYKERPATSIPVCTATTGLQQLNGTVDDVNNCPADTQCFQSESDMYTKFKCFGKASIPACTATTGLKKLNGTIDNTSKCPAGTECFKDVSDMYSKFECYGKDYAIDPRSGGHTAAPAGSSGCAPGDANCSSSAGTPCDPDDPQVNDKGEPQKRGEGIWTAIGCVPTNPTKFTQGMIKLAMGAGGGIALLLMAAGAFQMMVSAGNPDNLKKGQEQLTSAIVGLLFIIFSVLLLEIIGVDILGLDKLGTGLGR